MSPGSGEGVRPGFAFADVESLHDLATFVSRARAVDEGGAVRLQATGEVLAAWVRVLPGRGVLGDGVVLGLRVMPLAGPHTLDATVPLAAVADRMARRQQTGDVSTHVPVPPMTVTVPWTGLTPPRSGWQPRAQLSAAEVSAAAEAGVAQVAQGTPAGAGAHAVAALRERVWGAPGPAGLPAGVAFAAYALGFLRPGDVATVHACRPWARVSLPGGHVLVRAVPNTG